MKKISLGGVVLGAVLAIAVALIFGKWLFWLGTGLAVGLFLGASQARRGPADRSGARVGSAGF